MFAAWPVLCKPHDAYCVNIAIPLFCTDYLPKPDYITEQPRPLANTKSFLWYYYAAFALDFSFIPTTFDFTQTSNYSCDMVIVARNPFFSLLCWLYVQTLAWTSRCSNFNLFSLQYHKKRGGGLLCCLFPILNHARRSTLLQPTPKSICLPLTIV